MSTNPLRDGMRMSRVPGPGALVIFGASGDLAHRKLLPALYNLALRNMLPPAFALIGVARSDYGGDEGYRKEVRKALEAHSRTQPIDDAVFDTFARGLFYVSGSFDDPKTYAELKRRLAQADRERGCEGNAVFYLATPPTVFPLVTTKLGEAGLSRSRTVDALAS